ncbi:2062_t:CDS:2 [Gigaspora margarita]|uniref:2062_t:CDS:1 n=1 Tax=Gigaspora margarita TaxID=4874 RepID=A0ABN7UER8_GIGMA|nr:2062_t:CDS:2 [Gigaspora margarita]
MEDNPEECNQRNPSNSNEKLESSAKEILLLSDGSLRKEDKEKGNTAVIGVAVVQVNEKEEVSLKEVSVHTTG